MAAWGRRAPSPRSAAPRRSRASRRSTRQLRSSPRRPSGPPPALARRALLDASRSSRARCRVRSAALLGLTRVPDRASRLRRAGLPADRSAGSAGHLPSTRLQARDPRARVSAESRTPSAGRREPPTEAATKPGRRGSRDARGDPRTPRPEAREPPPGNTMPPPRPPAQPAPPRPARHGTPGYASAPRDRKAQRRCSWAGAAYIVLTTNVIHRVSIGARESSLRLSAASTPSGTGRSRSNRMVGGE